MELGRCEDTTCTQNRVFSLTNYVVLNDSYVTSLYNDMYNSLSRSMMGFNEKMADLLPDCSPRINKSI